MALPHCVPAAHSLLWKALLLGPSLIDSACSPHRLCRVIITPHCGREKAASICTKQDSYGPVSLGMREDLWNKKNNPPPKKKNNTFLTQIPSQVYSQSFPLCSLRAVGPPHLADLLLLPGSLHDFLLPIPWPSSVSPLPPPGGLLDSGSLEVVFGPS